MQEKQYRKSVGLIKWSPQLISLFIRVQRIPAGHKVEMSFVWFQEFKEPTKSIMLQLKMEKKTILVNKKEKILRHSSLVKLWYFQS